MTHRLRTTVLEQKKRINIAGTIPWFHCSASHVHHAQTSSTKKPDTGLRLTQLFSRICFYDTS